MALQTPNPEKENQKNNNMNIEQTLVNGVVEAIKSLYGAEFNAEKIQLQKTRKEFEGDYTVVVFPFLALSKKRPEETAQEIGEKIGYAYSSVEDVSEVTYKINKRKVKEGIARRLYLAE